MLKSVLSFGLFSLLFVITFSAQAHVSADVTNRSFPFSEFGAATISGALLATPTAAGLVRIPTTNPSRQNVISLENKAIVKSVYWPGRAGQPLVYLIPGIGGYSDRGNIGDLAKLFQSWGYHVITFNNPLNWQFALTLSPDGAPGYFPEDAQLLYKNMVEVTNQLKRKNHLVFSKTLLVAYSMGCQHAYELMKLDDQKKDFDFSQIVMLSPPLDIKYALRKYDAVNKVGAQRTSSTSLNYYERLRGRLIGLVENIMHLSPTKAVAFVAQNYPLSSRESEVIIGGTFKDSIEEVLYVTSLVHPSRSRLFKSPVGPSKRTDRYAEIDKITFEDYFQNFVLQKMFVRTQFIDSQDMLASFSLKNKIEKLQADPRVKMVLAKDDPISKTDDITLFSETLGDRALVLNHGGHAGFYWFPGFAADLKSFLKP